jgi:hypothetical protein
MGAMEWEREREKYSTMLDLILQKPRIQLFKFIFPLHKRLSWYRAANLIILLQAKPAALSYI